MAGRQSHKKNDVRNTTPYRYQGKLYGIFRNYMGDKYASQLVESMYGNYKSVFVDIYNKIHDRVRPLIISKAGAGASFVYWQLVNESIYATYLTHKESASFLLRKYQSRGLPPNDIKEVVAEVGNGLKELVPTVAQQIGDVKLDATNVISIVDGIVNKSPALPNSYAGTLLKQAIIQSTPHYEGTGTFSSYSEAYTTLEEIMRGL